MKTVKINGLLLLVVFSTSSNAGSMQNIYNDMYNITPPNFSQQGNGRYGASFGSFSYRPKLSKSVDVVSARLPNFSMDACGNIDMFAGSFSFISGDQLAQLARGIMQGAATYTFDLALRSISPMAADIKESLSKLVTSMNKFGKNSCQMGQNAAAALFGNDNTKAPEQGKVLHDELKAVSNAIGGAADWFDGKYNMLTSASETAETLGGTVETDYNSTKAALDGQDTQGSFFNSFGQMKKNELVMSIIGTTVTRLQGSSDCTSPAENGSKTCFVYKAPKGVFMFLNLFYDVENIESKEQYEATYYACADAANKCYDVRKKTSSFDRLYPMLQKDIGELWEKIYSGNQSLTGNEQKLNYYLGNDLVDFMKQFGVGGSNKDAYVRLKSLIMMKKIMDYVAQDIVTQTRAALTKTKTKNTHSKLVRPGTNESLAALKNFSEDYQKISRDTLETEINNRKDGFRLMMSLKSGR